MTSSTSTSPTSSQATPSPEPAAAEPAAAAAPDSGVVAASSGASQQKGATHISEPVVAKIAGLATREVRGVYDLGGGAARAWGALRERIPGGATNAAQGVSVEVGERQAAVDINLVVDYGVSIADLARAVRRNVIGSLERMTGLEVVEVNIAVDDLHLPSDGDGSQGDGTQRPSGAARVS